MSREDEERISQQYRDRELIEGLENLKDQHWLSLHPWAVKALQRHNPDLLRQIEVPRERPAAGFGLPNRDICTVCRGNRRIGSEEFEEMKLNRTRRMLTLWSGYNRQSGEFVYLLDNDGKVRRYPRCQAERAGFSLYGPDGQLTAVEK